MNEKELFHVKALDPKKRYEYFIKKVVDYEEVWGLYEDGWATSQFDDGSMAIPFWPKKEFALDYAKGEWSSYEPRSIDLEEFMSDWLPGIEQDGIQLSIFPVEGTENASPSFARLRADLEEELENY